MFKKTTLQNGFRMLTVPMGGVTTVTILVMVDTGSNNETKNLNGISHFLEHMFFKGTSRRKTAKIIAEEVDTMGGYSNAFTSQESTGYYLKVPAHKFDQALDLIADIFSNSLLDQEEVEKERGVILQELRMIHDDPARHVGDVFEMLLYGDEPAGRETIGTPETLANIRAENLREYFTSQYTVDDTFIVVAGNIDEDDAMEKINNQFSRIRRGTTKKRPALDEHQEKPAVSIISKETDQTHFILGTRAFGVKNPGRMGANLAAHILGGSMASRLFEELREKLGLAYAVQASFEGHTTYGWFGTYAGVEHKNIERAISVILNEYKKIASEKVPASELSRAKESLKGHLALSLESSNARAFYIGGEEVLTGRPMTVEEAFAKIDAVTPESIYRVTQEIIHPAKLNLAMIGPFTDAGPFEDILRGF